MPKGSWHCSLEDVNDWVINKGFRPLFDVCVDLSITEMNTQYLYHYCDM